MKLVLKAVMVVALIYEITETKPDSKASCVSKTPSKDLCVRKEPCLLKKPSTRSVTINSNITQKSLGVKKYGMTHHPTSFMVYVNDEPITLGESKKLSLKDNKLMVRYEYAFLGGKYKGCKELLFDLEPKKTSYTLGFSWNDEDHVQVSSATHISTKELYKK